MKKRTDADYINDIIYAINCTDRFIAGMSYEDFIVDEKTYHAVVRMFEIIGEACNKISDEVKNSNSEIPWRDIINMRNKIIHGYFDVNLPIVWDKIGRASCRERV